MIYQVKSNPHFKQKGTSDMKTMMMLSFENTILMQSLSKSCLIIDSQGNTILLKVFMCELSGIIHANNL